MNMRGYKVVHNGMVYNTVEVEAEFIPEMDKLYINIPDGHVNKPSYLCVWVINDDGLLVLIRDEARRFQFVKDLGDD